jgi:hypothetical protein
VQVPVELFNVHAGAAPALNMVEQHAVLERRKRVLVNRVVSGRRHLFVLRRIRGRRRAACYDNHSHESGRFYLVPGTLARKWVRAATHHCNLGVRTPEL